MTATETLIIGANTGITSFPAQIVFASGGFASGSTVAIPQHEPSAATRNVTDTPHAALSMALLQAGHDLREIDQEIASAFDHTLQDGISEAN